MTEGRTTLRVTAAPPGRRFPVAAAALVIGLLIGLGVLFAWRRSSTGAAAAAGGSSVLAVLPFENLGPSEDEYFADGVTDAVRGKLAAIPSVQVIARSSSVPYKKAAKSPEQIARELGVRYLLTGTVRWEKGAGGANRVQVSPELVEVSPGSAPRTRWQEPFDASITDVFQVQADVATRVAQALGATLGSGERQAIEAKPTRNLAAYDAYLKGEEISNGLSVIDPVLLRRALGYYEQAVALDSGFALAWARLSRTHSLLYFLSAPTPEDAQAALAGAQRVAALAPESPEARLAMGTYYATPAGDLPRALEQFTEGQHATPNNAELLAANYDDLYWILDDEQQRLVLRLTPSQFDNRRSTWASVLAQVYALRGDRARTRAYADSARASFEGDLKAASDGPQLHVFRGLMLAYLGRKEEAIREGLRAVELNPISRDAFGGPYIQLQLVRIYLLVGEPEQALDRLEPLLRIRNRLSPGWLRIDPTFDPLRSNPRFKRLVEGTT